MFESLRKKSALSALHLLVKSQQRARKIFTLDSAASIAILFDATSEKTRKEVLDWSKTLAKSNTKVTLLGYFDEKKAPATTPDFDFFILKETHWNYAPKSEKAHTFETKPTDMLLVINPDQRLPLEWIAVRHQGSMKVGMHTEHPQDFDLQIEIPADQGVPFFAKELAFYLAKIK